MSWIEILIIAAIFGYSIWMLVRHFKKSKQGACASCSMKNKCQACGVMNAAAGHQQESPQNEHA